MVTIPLVAADVQLLLTCLYHSFVCGFMLMHQRWDIAAGAGVVVAIPLAVAVTPPLYVTVDARLFSDATG